MEDKRYHLKTVAALLVWPLPPLQRCCQNVDSKFLQAGAIFCLGHVHTWQYIKNKLINSGKTRDRSGRHEEQELLTPSGICWKRKPARSQVYRPMF